MAETRKPESGTFTPVSRPTVATIAAQMGVSRATVTHVLNGRGTELRIRADTQRRVLQVAREMGYRTNSAARAVRSGRFGNLALIQSMVGQYLPNELLGGLIAATADKGLHLVLTQVHDIPVDDESYLPHTMNDLSVDGVLINRHEGTTQPFLEQIHRLRIPAVFLNVKQEFDCVHPDDLTGGRLATEHLLRLGHERIEYVDTDEPGNKHYSKTDRRHGYENAMRSAGKTPRVSLLPVGWRDTEQSSLDQRVASAQILLQRRDRPTAILAYELTEAMAVVRAAYAERLKIPEDLSLIQFHHWFDERVFPPIQTISNAMDRVGHKAVEMLLQKIESPETPLPACVVPVAILDGVTCLPPRA